MREILNLSIIISSVTLLNSYAVAQDFYYSNNRKIPLEKSTTDLVLKVSPSLSKGVIENGLTSTHSIKMVSYLNEETGLIWIKDKQGNAIKNSIAEVYGQLNIQKEIPVYYLDKSEKDTALFILTDEFRVKFKQHISSVEIDRINAQHNVVTVSVFNNEYTSGWHLLQVSEESSLTALQAANIYYESGLVEWSVPNYYTEFSYESIDDSYFYLQWYLENTGQEGVAGTDINAVKAWDITTGNTSTIVAVVDGGVENHEDFYSGQVLTGISLDNGGNIVGDGSPKTGDQDSEMHGQAVAGIIGANHNNIGMRGVAEKVKILPINVKYNNTSLNQILNIQNGIDWAWDIGNADVINISMGYQTGSNASQFYDDGVEDAIENAMTYGRQNKGSLVVKSAGNLGYVSFPGNVPGVLTVGGLDAWGDPASGTAMDPTYNFLDVVAPTGDTDPLGNPVLFSMDRMGSFGSNGYGPNYEDVLYGTSFAAPQVSGIAALMLAVNSNLTKAQIFDIIKDRASLHDYGPTQWDGRGRVDAYESVKEALPNQYDNHSFSSSVTLGSSHINDANISAGVTLTVPSNKVIVLEGDIISSGTNVFINIDGKVILNEGTTVEKVHFIVEDGGELIIQPGAVIELSTGQWHNVKVNPGGKITAHGTEDDPIYFKRYSPGTAWGQIGLRSSEGNSFKWVVFDGGNKTVEIQSNNNIFEHCTFKNGVRGISGYYNQDGAGNGSATCTYCLFENNSTVGVVAQYFDLDMSYSTIRNNTQAGLYVSSSEVYPFHHNIVTGNGYYLRDGIEVTSSGTIYLNSDGLGNGYNEIKYNADDQISGSGDLFLGLYTAGGGYNSIRGDYSGGKHLVDNNTGTTVEAWANHWDQNDTGYEIPGESMFDGTVSALSYLTSNPTTAQSPGAGTQVPSKSIGRQFISSTDAYDEALEALPSAANEQQVRDRVYKMYQIAETSKDAGLKHRFKEFSEQAGSGSINPFSSGSKNTTLRNFAKILHTRSLIREGNYDQVKSYMDRTNTASLDGYDKRDWLHFRVVTETYHGNYEAAWEALQDYYTFQEAQGENIEEVRANNSTLEEDLLEHLEQASDSPEKKAVLNENNISLSAHPNPFNPTTTISFELTEPANVTLKVYDLLGREVSTLVNGRLSAQTHTYLFDATNLSSGIYIYQLQTGKTFFTQRMTLIK